MKNAVRLSFVSACGTIHFANRLRVRTEKTKDDSFENFSCFSSDICDIVKDIVGKKLQNKSRKVVEPMRKLLNWFGTDQYAHFSGSSRRFHPIDPKEDRCVRHS